MSNEIEELNKAINLALRSIDRVARMVAGMEFEPKGQNIRLAAEALEALTTIQRQIFESNPDLEFHYDESRPDTSYMSEFREHLDQASRYEALGQTDAALAELQKAISMELPPLPFEVVTREIRRIGEHNA